jgi:hypothetical protein
VSDEAMHNGSEVVWSEATRRVSCKWQQREEMVSEMGEGSCNAYAQAFNSSAAIAGGHGGAS